MDRPFPPHRIIPAQLAEVVRDLPYWFVIGGHAVRCFCPYRPSREDYFLVNAGSLLVPPGTALEIQAKVVDVIDER